MKLNIDKSIDYGNGYEFNVTETLAREQDGVLDGWRSRNSFDLKECELKLKEDIKNIIQKYGQKTSNRNN